MKSPWYIMHKVPINGLELMVFFLHVFTYGYQVLLQVVNGA